MSLADDPVIFIFNFIGSLVCHQFPERTLWIGGHYLPVCARDTGAYVGLLLGYLLLPMRKKDADGPPNLWLTTLLVLPMIVDAATQWLGLRASTNEIRLATGLFFGIGVAPFLTYLLSMVPSSGGVPFLRTILPRSVALDSSDHWLSNRVIGVSFLLGSFSFVAINSIVRSVEPVFYWSLSSLIVISVIWHIFLLPAFLIALLLIILKTRPR